MNDAEQGQVISRYLFEEADVNEVIEEGPELLLQHYQELSHYPDIELDIDEERYRLANAGGFYLAATVRDRVSSKLVGYCSFMMSFNIHYRSSKQALQDVFYIAPEHRGHRLGAQLIEFTEELLRKNGVQVVIHGCKLAHPQFGQLLKYCGYDEVEVSWQKRLDEA